MQILEKNSPPQKNKQKHLNAYKVAERYVGNLLTLYNVFQDCCNKLGVTL